MKTKIVLIVFAVALVTAGVFWAGGGPARLNAAFGTAPPEGGSASQGEPPANPELASGTSAASVGSDDQLRLGGAGLKLQDVYRNGLARRGSDDQTLASVVDFARVMCSIPYPSDDEGWKDPNRRWAMVYMQSACSGFDSSDYRFTGENRNALWYMNQVGEKEAREVALKDLHRTDNMLEVGVAINFLVGRGLFPDQEKYGLSNEDMSRIALMAGKLRTCGAVGACGADSLITAELCARVGCRPGTPYADAVRRDLSPKEYEAMLKMRAALAAM